MTNFADMPLLEVAQLNTPEALDYFWANVDDGYFADREWFYEYVADECKTIIDLREDISILDVGCAHGHFLNAIEKAFGGKLYWVMGIDYAKSAVQYSRQQFPDMWHDFQVVDITQVYQDKSICHLITCIQTLEHIRKWQAAIKNISDLVHGDGDIVITIPNGAHDRYPGHVNFWTEDEMAEHLAQYGEVRSWKFNDGNNLFFHVRKSNYPDRVYENKMTEETETDIVENIHRMANELRAAVE